MPSTDWKAAKLLGSGEYSSREEWLPQDHPDRIAWETERTREAHRAVVQKAKLLHDTYERLAPQFGYETRPDTKHFDIDSPNGRLMIAVIKELGW